METTAYLIKKASYTTDEIGQKIPTEPIRREIFCRIESIYRNEFEAAGKQGIRASLTLITPAINYENEELVEYENEMYSVYRTFRNPYNDDIELYLEKKGSNE